MDEVGELVLVCTLEVFLDADDRRLAGREELGAEWLLFVHLGLMYESQMASFGPGKEWMV